MEPVIITFDKNGEYKTFEPSLSETFIYVIDGSIRLTLGKPRILLKKVKPCITKQQNLTKLATMVEEKSCVNCGDRIVFIKDEMEEFIQ